MLGPVTLCSEVVTKPQALALAGELRDMGAPPTWAMTGAVGLVSLLPRRARLQRSLGVRVLLTVCGAAKQPSSGDDDGFHRGSRFDAPPFGDARCEVCVQRVFASLFG